MSMEDFKKEVLSKPGARERIEKYKKEIVTEQVQLRWIVDNIKEIFINNYDPCGVTDPNINAPDDEYDIYILRIAETCLSYYKLCNQEELESLILQQLEFVYSRFYDYDDEGNYVDQIDFYLTGEWNLVYEPIMKNTATQIVGYMQTIKNMRSQYHINQYLPEKENKDEET